MQSFDETSYLDGIDIHHISIFPDEKRLAILVTGLGKNEIRILDIKTGKCLNILSTPNLGNNNVFNCFAVLDENHIIAGTSSGSLGTCAIVGIWDIESGQCKAVYKDSGINADEAPRKITVFQNKQVVIGFYSIFVSIQINEFNEWKYDTRKILKTYGLDTSSHIVLISPNLMLASASSGGPQANRYPLKLWDIAQGKCIKTFDGYTAKAVLSGVQLQNLIISGDAEGEIKVWNMDSEKCVNTLKGHCGQVSNIKALSNRQIVSASYDKKIKVWDIARSECLNTIEGNAGLIMCMDGLSDGSIIFGTNNAYNILLMSVNDNLPTASDLILKGLNPPILIKLDRKGTISFHLFTNSRENIPVIVELDNLKKLSNIQLSHACEGHLERMTKSGSRNHNFEDGLKIHLAKDTNAEIYNAIKEKNGIRINLLQSMDKLTLEKKEADKKITETKYTKPPIVSSNLSELKDEKQPKMSYKNTNKIDNKKISDSTENRNKKNNAISIKEDAEEILDCYITGLYFEIGYKTVINSIEALKYYFKVFDNNGFEKIHEKAIRDDAVAQFIMGHIYFVGRNVKKDYDKSFSWFQKSADGGNILGKKFLSRSYNDGCGVENNKELADYWNNQVELMGYKFDKFQVYRSQNNEIKYELFSISGFYDSFFYSRYSRYSRSDDKDIERIEELLNGCKIGEFDTYNVDINSSDGSGNTPLHFSAATGRSKLTRFLCSKGANSNILNEDNETPLMLAIRYSFIEPIEIFRALHQSTSVDIQNNEGKSLIFLALEKKYFSIFRTLLNSNANTNYRDNQGNTLFLTAVKLNAKEFIKELMKREVEVYDTNDLNENILMLSAYNKESDYGKIFISQGISVDGKNKNGKTAFTIALENGNLKLCQQLTCSRLLFLIANQQIDCLDTETWDFLFKNGGNINQRDSKFRTLCHVSAAKNNTEFFEYLVEKEDVSDDVMEAADMDGNTVEDIFDNGGYDNCFYDFTDIIENKTAFLGLAKYDEKFSIYEKLLSMSFKLMDSSLDEQNAGIGEDKNKSKDTGESKITTEKPKIQNNLNDKFTLLGSKTNMSSPLKKAENISKNDETISAKIPERTNIGESSASVSSLRSRFESANK